MLRPRLSARVIGPLAVLSLLLVGGCGSSGKAGGDDDGKAAAPARTTLHLLVIGDSIPFGRFCGAGCTGFVDRYAERLEASGRVKVEVDNRSRDDSADLAAIRAQVKDDQDLGAALAEADTVIVSVGFNDGPPYAPDRPCRSPEARTAEDQVRSVLASTTACTDATVASYRRDYTEVFGPIESLVKDSATLLALQVYSNWEGNPDVEEAVDDRDLPALRDRLVRTYDAWNAMLCATAAEHRFACVDTYHRFNGPDGRAAAGDLLRPDYTHPSQQGNDAIAELLPD